MSREYVPVSMGSPVFTVVDAGSFRITDAWFPPGAHLPRHAHERTTFAVMIDGSFDLTLHGQRLECAPSTVLTEPAGESHANEIGSQGAHVVVVQPDPSDAELIEPCARMLERLNHFRDAFITSQARRLGREVREPDDVSPLAMQAVVLDMFAKAARLDVAQRRAAAPPEWLSRLTDLVHDRFRERLTIRDLAAEAGVHPSHLASVFREHHNMPVGEYIRRLKLDWAADRLLASSQPLGRIALAAGFADQSHFTRAFKKRMGMTPGMYRRLRDN